MRKTCSSQCMYDPVSCTSLWKLDGWCWWLTGSLRSLWWESDGESSFASREHQFLPIISMQLHVLALFSWNFAAWQNDIQGNGELEHGNWITGIPFFWQLATGWPEQAAGWAERKQGTQRLLLYATHSGLIGLFWQAFRGKRGISQFWVVFFLFFMTGLAIVIYLNQTPMQPRERDYAYAGSFYAFTIWCVSGVAAIIDWLKKYKINGVLASSVVVLHVYSFQYRWVHKHGTTMTAVEDIPAAISVRTI